MVDSDGFDDCDATVTIQLSPTPSPGGMTHSIEPWLRNPLVNCAKAAGLHGGGPFLAPGTMCTGFT